MIWQKWNGGDVDDEYTSSKLSSSSMQGTSTNFCVSLSHVSFECPNP